MKLVQPSTHILTKRLQQAVQDDTSLYDGQGRKQFPNGDFYEGQFRRGKLEGRGTLVTARGDVYEGQFKNGFKHGKGKITYARAAGSYEGEWVYNKMEGRGVSVDG